MPGMFSYHQISGQLLRDGQPVAFGYSGHLEGRNNPAFQQVHNVGPIPQGLWSIEGPPFDSDDHGPFCLRLTPAPETRVFNRSGFLMHGDSKVHPGLASEGCIIMPRAAREQVWNSRDTNLTVSA